MSLCVHLQPLIGISPRKPAPQTLAVSGQNRDVRDLEHELEREREQKRKLQQELIRTEAELMDLKMETKMKHFNQELTGDHTSIDTDPSAPPPPPYGTSVSPNHSFTSYDNNIDVTSDEEDDHLNSTRVVRVDVHSANSRRTASQACEFSFTDSVLEYIESDEVSHCTLNACKNPK